MQFKKGVKNLVSGSSGQIRHLMSYLSTQLYKQGKNVLLIDTTNSLNLHDSFFNDSLQDQYFKYIYCVRTPMPYDLWARLGTSKGFIKKNKIDTLLITNLSLLFKESPFFEVEPLMNNILERIDKLTEEFQLTTIIGISPSSDESAINAESLLSSGQYVQDVS